MQQNYQNLKSPLRIGSGAKLNTIQEVEAIKEDKYVSIRGKSASKKVSKRKVIVSTGKSKKKSKSVEKVKLSKEKYEEPRNPVY